jgi:mono/diheme cytochrome c family protein
VTSRGKLQLLAGAALAAVALSGSLNAQGKSASDIYLDKCSVCHGVDGAGKTAKGKKLKVKDVREQVTKLTADKMAEVVTKGKDPDMDAFGKDFTPEQIGQVVAYYRELAKKK